jgi:GNAT superfamily N-acetyltransferase
MVKVRRIASGDSAAIPQLIALLQDAVNGGASVGFLAPLRQETAARYWDRVLTAVDRELFLWVAEADGRIVGSVQLEVCGKENGDHRAELQKLFVLQNYRGRSISSKLMAAAEEFAVAQGRTLLVLDTQAGSKAETVYRHLGWQPAGQIPNYARSSDGQLHATAYFYKDLSSRPPA